MRQQRRAPLAVGTANRQWRTIPVERTVLGVIHNVTSATRLLDLLTVLEGDQRIHTVFTCTGSSALDAGTEEFAAAKGMHLLSWEEAKATKFDAAIATSRGGDLHNLLAPLIGSPHGAGYNKQLSREPGAGSREPGAGSREPGAFGLTAEWLMYDGHVVPSVVVLSHDEQLRRLGDSCPEAVPVSVVAGDPCIDQLRAARPFRGAYRQAFGLLPGQKLVVVSTTWGEGSVLGSVELQVLRRVLAELPADEFRVVAAVHPNAWFGHGAWQIRSWLSELTEAGLLLPSPETDTWKAALVAADSLVGDHGSVTLYGVALGVPCVLGSFNEDKVAPDSPMQQLGRVAPRLAPSRGLREQLDGPVVAPEVAAVGELVTSRPGAAARLLRALFYEHIGLPEPAAPARITPIPLPRAEVVGGSPLSPVCPPRYVSVTGTDPVIVRRYPARLQSEQSDHLADAHLVADRDDPDPSWPSSADILLVPAGRTPTAPGTYGSCWMVAEQEDDHDCLLTLADGRRLRARWLSRPAWADFAVAASVAYASLPASPVRVSAGEGLAEGLLAISPV